MQYQMTTVVCNILSINKSSTSCILKSIDIILLPLYISVLLKAVIRYRRRRGNRLLDTFLCTANAISKVISMQTTVQFTKDKLYPFNSGKCGRKKGVKGERSHWADKHKLAVKCLHFDPIQGLYFSRWIQRWKKKLPVFYLQYIFFKNYKLFQLELLALC